MKWLDGDMNSKFFHSCVQSKRLRLHISKMKENSGNWTENPQEIAQLGITYFQQLYSDELNYSHQYYNQLETALSCIPKIINGQDNDLLEKYPSFDEVRCAVFSLDPESAAGPDGFTGVFFQKCWERV